MCNWAYEGVLLSIESRGPWQWHRVPWIWKVFSPPMLLLALCSSAETMSYPSGKRKGSVILAKVILKVLSLGVCTCKQVLQVLSQVRQEPQLDWFPLAAWFSVWITQRWCLLPFINLVQGVTMGILFVYTPKDQRTKVRKLRDIGSGNGLRRFYSRSSPRSYWATFLLFLFSSTSASCGCNLLSACMAGTVNWVNW